MARVAQIIQNMQVKMILQVHDELIFELSKKEIEVARIIKQVMELSPTSDFTIPLVVDVEAGTSYGTLQPFSC